MEPADRIEPLDWMTGGAGATVHACLAEGGAVARFVGGPVRDAVIGRPVKDLDMATDAAPARVIELAKAARIKAVPTGIEHGTVTLVVGGIPVEVTTLRRDVKTDGRRAVVAFTDDWAEDAARRDFTLNALYLDPDGTLYDPTGLGIADARAGLIRFVGDATRRIVEDALRILRLFRFQASHGRVPPHADGLAACVARASSIGQLSGERVWSELKKLLLAPGAVEALRLLSRTGIDRELWPRGGGDAARAADLVALEDGLGVTPVAARRLAAMIGGDAEPAIERLKLSRAERDRLLAARQPLDPVPATDPERRAAIYRLGAERFLDRRLLAALDGALEGLERDLEMAESWTPPVFPLAGADLIAAGLPRGPGIGETLRAIEEWWIAGGFTADRAACLARARALRQAQGDKLV